MAVAQGERRRRPKLTQLIGLAIRASKEHRCTVDEIYRWLSNKHPKQFALENPKWKGVVRNRLSHTKYFAKQKGQDDAPGKSNYWTTTTQWVRQYIEEPARKRAGTTCKQPAVAGRPSNRPATPPCPANNYFLLPADANTAVAQGCEPLFMTGWPPAISSWGGCREQSPASNVSDAPRPLREQRIRQPGMQAGLSPFKRNRAYLRPGRAEEAIGDVRLLPASPTIASRKCGAASLSLWQVSKHHTQPPRTPATETGSVAPPPTSLSLHAQLRDHRRTVRGLLQSPDGSVGDVSVPQSPPLDLHEPAYGGARFQDGWLMEDDLLSVLGH